MRLMVLALLLIAATDATRSALSEQSATAPISGNARSAVVFDGDSLDFAGRRFQLAGIDAPELGQSCVEEAGPKETCGLTAAYELRKRLQIDPRPLRCWPVDEGAERGADGSVLASCAAAENDLALALVESGYVRALPDAQIDYRLAEEKARDAGIGLWATDPEAPWKWREARAEDRANSPAQGCVIAGMIEQGGKKLYYGPLDPDYAKKTAKQARGERWFCSDEDARAAGWRRPDETPPS